MCGETRITSALWLLVIIRVNKDTRRPISRLTSTWLNSNWPCPPIRCHYPQWYSRSRSQYDESLGLWLWLPPPTVITSTIQFGRLECLSSVIVSTSTGERTSNLAASSLSVSCSIVGCESASAFIGVVGLIIPIIP